jgi:hypothetical protein
VENGLAAISRMAMVEMAGTDQRMLNMEGENYT